MFRAIAVLFGIFICFCSRLVADELSVADMQQRILSVVETTQPAIVEISRRGSLFSGVIVSPQGHVLTAGHTVTPGQQYTINLPDGRRLRGHSLGACEQMRGDRIDCGLIMIDEASDLPHVRMGSSQNLRAGQPCLSISYPGGQRGRREPLVRFGFVNKPVRKGAMIESTALMEPGDSGGPLFDLSGRVIGIHSRISTSMHQNFDVPIDVFKEYWDQLNVPSTFQTRNGRQLPKLGFIGEDYPEKGGIHVLEVNSGSIAESLGLKPDDYLTRVQDKSISRLSELQDTLLGLVKDQPATVALSVKRGEELLEFQFPSERLGCPRAARIIGMDDDPNSSPDYFPQANNLMGEFAALESSLDDNCCEVSSSVDGTETKILGTLIADSLWIVSKSSMVGGSPTAIIGGRRVELKVSHRDDANDLILLEAPTQNLHGVDISSTVSELDRGSFLVTPDPDGPGFSSVSSSSKFPSNRQFSRGYLGVVLQDNDQGGVVLVQVDQGAAKKAGLQPGDVILQVNETVIRNRPEILRFLGSVDPLTSIKAKIRREAAEFETDIRLGSPPSDSNHAADMMDKSLRRDGFEQVICHDALVEPSSCGGPVFDLHGKLVGLNIARHSRVRTFIVPAKTISNFIAAASAGSSSR